jgi:site-specific DNA-methyltransferase (adenine-specific)
MSSTLEVGQVVYAFVPDRDGAKMRAKIVNATFPPEPITYCVEYEQGGVGYHERNTLEVSPFPAKWETAWRSDKQDWETPQGLFDWLNEQYHFTLDVCATQANAKVARYFSLTDDGLAQSWADEVCFMNPPYGRSVGKWIEKARSEAEKGATVVCLVYARTGAAWYQDHVPNATCVHLIRTRLRFVGAKSSAPSDSAIIIFTPEGGPPEYHHTTLTKHQRGLE